MYSLTFCVRVATPTQYGRNGTASLQITSHTQQARRFYRWCVRACVRREVCAGPGGLLLGSATHFHTVAIATHPVHRLQIRPIVHNWGQPLPLSQVTSGSVQYCKYAAADRHTDTQTDACDHNTFLVVFDSREM